MDTGQQTTQFAEIQYLMRKVEESKIPEDLKEQANIMLKRIRRMARQGRPSNEYEYIARYIDWILKVPWNAVTEDNLDLQTVKTFMDEMHYGSEPAKQVILEYLSVIKIKMEREQKKSFQPPVLLFVGPHGCGKTSLARAVAHALGRAFVRIPMGALGGASELRGIPKGHDDAEPGQIIKAMVRSKTKNPVILLDEIDKVSGERAQHYNFMAILLEILDPQQNKSFRDLFIDYPIDLSSVFFIGTGNTTKTITDALLDRVEVLEFPDYKVEEKVIIARDYLFPRVLEYTKVTGDEVRIDDSAWRALVKKYGSEAGVRTLEKGIEKLVRKAALKFVTGQASNVSVTKTNLEQILGDSVSVGQDAVSPVSTSEPETQEPTDAKDESTTKQTTPQEEIVGKEEVAEEAPVAEVSSGSESSTSDIPTPMATQEPSKPQQVQTLTDHMPPVQLSTQTPPTIPAEVSTEPPTTEPAQPVQIPDTTLASSTDDIKVEEKTGAGTSSDDIADELGLSNQ